METVKIILLCVGAGILYGILHDQVTARVCVEYFTIGHPPVFDTESPTLLAFGWGVLATWWVGLFLGILMALASRVGTLPKYTAAHLIRPIAGLLVVMGCASLLAGIAGYFMADTGRVWLNEPLRLQLSREKELAFIADLWAHCTAYGVAAVGGIGLCFRVPFSRWRMSRAAQAHPHAPVATAADGQ